MPSKLLPLLRGQLRQKLAKRAKLMFIPLRYITAIDVVISLIVDPHMWTVEQRGTVKLAISLVAPFFMAHSRVTGITAELEQIEKPVRYAGIIFHIHLKGFFLATSPAIIYWIMR